MPDHPPSLVLPAASLSLCAAGWASLAVLPFIDMSANAGLAGLAALFYGGLGIGLCLIGAVFGAFALRTPGRSAAGRTAAWVGVIAGAVPLVVFLVCATPTAWHWLTGGGFTAYVKDWIATSGGGRP